MSLWRARYGPHAAFVAPARAQSELWRLLLGTVLCAVLYAAFGLMFLSFASGTLGIDILDDGLGQTAPGLLVLLLHLGFMAVAAALVCQVLHRRAPRTLVGDVGRAVQQFVGVSMALVMLIFVISVLPPYSYGGPLTVNLTFWQWVGLLPLALPALLVQVSGEEILFRGYLQQQLAARWNTPLVWMVVPAVIFGALHYDPSLAGRNAIYFALWAALFGLAAADLTARAGTLGPAIALHFWNNLVAMLVVSPRDEMSGLALYTLPYGMGDETMVAAWLPVDLAWILVSWLACRLALRA